MYENLTEAQINDLKESYIANECHSDEYRETQPFKGVRHIASAIEMLENDADARKAAELLNIASNWCLEVTGDGDGYAGADSLEKVLEKVFDVFKEHEEHPYFDDREELLEFLEDT